MKIQLPCLRVSLASLAALVSLGAPLQATPTDVALRDPSTIVQREGVYYLYGTGTGTQQFSSRDKVHWTPLGPVFPKAPAWVGPAAPRNRDNTAWAPDIAFFGGEYRLYTSYSEFGTNHSVIGLATNPTLDPRGWTDRGAIISSSDATPFNTIDPGVFQDARGAWWMSFGSYFNGIHVAPLDVATGKIAVGVPLRRIATRPGVETNPIEASTIYFHDGWYYLFTNWGNVVRGARSTYNIRVQRSREVTGPYLDKSGKSALRGGGTLFLGSVFDDESGRPIDDQVAPGHVGILREGDAFTLSIHYEWSRFLQGKTTVNVLPLAWDSDGWPRAVFEPTPLSIVSSMATHATLEADGAQVKTNVYQTRPTQEWKLQHLGDGFYSLASTQNGLVMGTAGGASAPGTLIELAPYTGLDSQKWHLRQNEDGTYSVLLKSGGQRVALDVPTASLLDGVALHVWTDNLNAAQKWSFRAR